MKAKKVLIGFAIALIVISVILGVLYYVSPEAKYFMEYCVSGFIMFVKKNAIAALVKTGLVVAKNGVITLVKNFWFHFLVFIFVGLAKAFAKTKLSEFFMNRIVNKVLPEIQESVGIYWEKFKEASGYNKLVYLIGILLPASVVSWYLGLERLIAFVVAFLWKQLLLIIFWFWELVRGVLQPLMQLFIFAVFFELLERIFPPFKRFVNWFDQQTKRLANYITNQLDQKVDPAVDKVKEGIKKHNEAVKPNKEDKQQE